jgi:predicted 3-demethylubiquinone-9 3-methyltransferase (glyoxalase superfamily)
MPKIRPCLWFDTQAEEAAEFYVSLFDDSRIERVVRTGPVTLVTFRLAGIEYLALNGGPQFRFTEAISMYVDADTQDEIDRLWDALIADGGEPSMCGWLKDRYGLSWQIIPPVLGQLIAHPDQEKAGRVMQAMLQMRKIEIQPLLDAAAG